MSIIDELEKLYFDIENSYAAKEFLAHAKGHFHKENLWKRKRELNTHAYFLFVFTRLEDHIRESSIKLITDKRADISHWKTKAIWVNTDEKKLYFKNRLGLLTEKGSTDETYMPESIALIQVSGTGVHNNKALQVEPVCVYLISLLLKLLHC